MIELEQKIHHLARHRTWQNVAADDNSIDGGRADLGENSLERGEVAMNVVEDRDAHWRISTWAGTTRLRSASNRLTTFTTGIAGPARDQDHRDPPIARGTA